MTIDVDENIWVACFNGGKVVKFNPKTGTKIKLILFNIHITCSGERWSSGN